MKRRTYKFRYMFFETIIFIKDYGIISESERERLHFDLMLGRGKLIKDTGGLKEIRCGIAGANGKKGWDVVFADYNFPERREHIFFLFSKYPIGTISKLGQEEKRMLRKIKEKLDEDVDRYYWKFYE